MPINIETLVALN